jgi:hypothetical protein
MGFELTTNNHTIIAMYVLRCCFSRSIILFSVLLRTRKSSLAQTLIALLVKLFDVCNLNLVLSFDIRRCSSEAANSFLHFVLNASISSRILQNSDTC